MVGSYAAKGISFRPGIEAIHHPLAELLRLKGEAPDPLPDPRAGIVPRKG